MQSEDPKYPEAGADASAFDVSDPYARTDRPVYQVTLWPNRSLSHRGFKAVLIFVATGLSIPLLPLLGTPVAWGMLPFLLAALIALYTAIKRNYRDGRLTETLRLWPDLVTVERIEPRGEVRRWHANPFWVDIQIKDTRHLESYLTLRGNGRVIELGAFLSPEERRHLKDDLSKALRALHAPSFIFL